MRKRDDSRTREGYLLLADISGYTAFFTGTELEHAQEIIRELTSLVRARLSPPMRFVKREGDAVFCYADAATFRDAERFVELIEACYFDYSNHLDDMVRETTCRCNACGAIGSLGLKFVAHHGSYIVERDGKQEDLAGPDVILAHRLLKNSISENGGPQAYAYFTDACVQHMPRTMHLPKHSETYDFFGEVSGAVHDLALVLAEMRENRRAYITSGEADIESVVDLPVPPSVAWKYFVDPIERQRWACRQFGKDPDEMEVNAAGRAGLGSSTHCGHAPAGMMNHRKVTDWRPFSYFTCHTVSPAAGSWVTGRPIIETVEFTPQGAHGSHISWRWRIVDRRRVPMMVFAATRPLLRAFNRRMTAALVGIASEDAEAIGLDEIPAAR